MEISNSKRPRKSNFSVGEIRVLLEEIILESKTLFATECTTVMNKRKMEIWNRILTKVNACGVAVRTVVEIRDKWKSLKSSVMTRQRGLVKSGGDKPVPFEDVIVSIIGAQSNLSHGIKVEGTETIVQPFQESLPWTPNHSGSNGPDPNPAAPDPNPVAPYPNAMAPYPNAMAPYPNPMASDPNLMAPDPNPAAPEIEKPEPWVSPSQSMQPELCPLPDQADIPSSSVVKEEVVCSDTEDTPTPPNVPDKEMHTSSNSAQTVRRNGWEERRRQSVARHCGSASVEQALWEEFLQTEIEKNKSETEKNKSQMELLEHEKTKVLLEIEILKSKMKTND